MSFWNAAKDLEDQPYSADGSNSGPDWHSHSSGPSTYIQIDRQTDRGRERETVKESAHCLSLPLSVCLSICLYVLQVLAKVEREPIYLASIRRAGGHIPRLRQIKTPNPKAAFEALEVLFHPSDPGLRLNKPLPMMNRERSGTATWSPPLLDHILQCSFVFLLTVPDRSRFVLGSGLFKRRPHTLVLKSEPSNINPQTVDPHLQRSTPNRNS